MPKIASALLLSVLAGSAGAQTFLTATLNNASENPPTVPTTAGGQPRPASFGTASFFIDSAASFMTFTATIFNIDVTGTQTPNDINDNLTNAHIHAGPLVTPTTNAGVVWGFFGSPLNDTAPNDFVFTPFTTGVVRADRRPALPHHQRARVDPGGRNDLRPARRPADLSRLAALPARQHRRHDRRHGLRRARPASPP